MSFNSSAPLSQHEANQPAPANPISTNPTINNLDAAKLADWLAFNSVSNSNLKEPAPIPQSPISTASSIHLAAVAPHIPTVTPQMQNAVNLSSSRASLSAIPFAPSYYPTAEEFRDPFRYISTIRAEASQYGVCKIVPPQGWKPKFDLNYENVRFRTKLQRIDQLQKREKPKPEAFLPQTKNKSKKSKKKGKTNTIAYNPSYNNINNTNNNVDTHTSACNNSYNNHNSQENIIPKDTTDSYINTGNNTSSNNNSNDNSTLAAGNAVESEEKMQIDPSADINCNSDESTLPPTEFPNHNSCSSTDIIPANSPTGSDQDFENEASFLDQLQQYLLAEKNTKLPQVVQICIENGTNRGTAINLYQFFGLITAAGGIDRVENSITWPNLISELGCGHILGKDVQKSLRVTWNRYLKDFYADYMRTRNYNNGTSDCTAATDMVTDKASSSNSENKRKFSATDNKARSARAKKSRVDYSALENGSDILVTSVLDSQGRSQYRYYHDIRCASCDGPDHAEKLLLCDNCDSGFHIFCLSPPLEAIPPSHQPWFCSECSASMNNAFGFEMGDEYSITSYKAKADAFKANWFGSRGITQPSELTTETVTAEFWRIVETADHDCPVAVEYGSDLDTTVLGSGYPKEGPYSKAGWNLNNLPVLSASVFRHLDDQTISGITIPWLYVGMCFSTFCWHNEDHYSYSINYVHEGADKQWYGISNFDAGAFEKRICAALPELFRSSPDLLFQLVTMVSPTAIVNDSKLGANDAVKVHQLIQHSGEFVITFPQAFHTGFNTGFNIAESVNFAPADWLPFGVKCSERYRFFRRSPVFSHHQLLMQTAEYCIKQHSSKDNEDKEMSSTEEEKIEDPVVLPVPSNAAPKNWAVAAWLYAALCQLRDTEYELRQRLYAVGTCKGCPWPDFSQSSSNGGNSTAKFSVGQRVQAMWKDDGYYYFALIIQVKGDGGYKVKFEQDGIVAEVYEQDIKLLQAAQNQKARTNEWADFQHSTGEAMLDGYSLSTESLIPRLSPASPIYDKPALAEQFISGVSSKRICPSHKAAHKRCDMNCPERPFNVELRKLMQRDPAAAEHYNKALSAVAALPAAADPLPPALPSPSPVVAIPGTMILTDNKAEETSAVPSAVVNCAICRHALWVSCVRCHCSPDKAACLNHSAELCGCEARSKFLHFRYSLYELDEICAEVAAILAVKPFRHRETLYEMDAASAKFTEEEIGQIRNILQESCELLARSDDYVEAVGVRDTGMQASSNNASTSNSSKAEWNSVVELAWNTESQVWLSANSKLADSKANSINPAQLSSVLVEAERYIWGSTVISNEILKLYRCLSSWQQEQTYLSRSLCSLHSAAQYNSKQVQQAQRYLNAKAKPNSKENKEESAYLESLWATEPRVPGMLTLPESISLLNRCRNSHVQLSCVCSSIAARYGLSKPKAATSPATIQNKALLLVEAAQKHLDDLVQHIAQANFLLIDTEKALKLDYKPLDLHSAGAVHSPAVLNPNSNEGIKVGYDLLKSPVLLRNRAEQIAAFRNLYEKLLAVTSHAALIRTYNSDVNNLAIKAELVESKSHPASVNTPAAQPVKPEFHRIEQAARSLNSSTHSVPVVPSTAFLLAEDHYSSANIAAERKRWVFQVEGLFNASNRPEFVPATFSVVQQLLQQGKLLWRNDSLLADSQLRSKGAALQGQLESALRAASSISYHCSLILNAGNSSVATALQVFTGPISSGSGCVCSQSISAKMHSNIVPKLCLCDDPAHSKINCVLGCECNDCQRNPRRYSVCCAAKILQLKPQVDLPELVCLKQAVDQCNEWSKRAERVLPSNSNAATITIPFLTGLLQEGEVLLLLPPLLISLRQHVAKVVAAMQTLNEKFTRVIRQFQSYQEQFYAGKINSNNSTLLNSLQQQLEAISNDTAKLKITTEESRLAKHFQSQLKQAMQNLSAASRALYNPTTAIQDERKQ
jgi:hypothetical protein